MLNEGIAWSGRIKITTFYKDGTKDVEEFDNLIVNTGLNMMRRALKNGNEKTQIFYVGLGTDATAPAATDTTLGSEQFRKQITAQSLAGTGALTTTVYIAPGEANSFTIEEIGWFAGSATGTADTGTLVARVNYSKAKTDAEAIQIDRTDTFS